MQETCGQISFSNVVFMFKETFSKAGGLSTLPVIFQRDSFGYAPNFSPRLRTSYFELSVMGELELQTPPCDVKLELLDRQQHHRHGFTTSKDRDW